MNNCEEFVLDDLMAITAIPVTKILPNSKTSPALRLTKTFSATFIDYFDADTTVIGRQKVVGNVEKTDNRGRPYTAKEEVGKLIPIRRFTGRAVDNESDGVAGRMHTVKVTCEVDDRESAVWEDLFTLERTPCHLLLTFRDGVTQGFVSATEDTYTCEVERDKSKTTVTLRIQNLMGIQRITAS